MSILYTFTLRRGFVALVAAATALVWLAGAGLIDPVGAAPQPTHYYFVRHAEIDKQNPDKPLNEKGKARARALAGYFDGVRVSFIYATHTDRTRDTVSPLAGARRLKVVQVPEPGTNINGTPVTNRTSGKIAIEPMVVALKGVPPGSAVVVAGNSGNLYAVMAGLGVPVSGEDAVCTDSPDTCVPCREKSCFPKKEFNAVWKVVAAGSDGGSARLVRSTYGD